jgi:hypothetical protein
MIFNNTNATIRKTLILVIALPIAVVTAFAQSNSSPYSMFGLGSFNSKGDVRSYGMGGAGMALPSDDGLGNLNVASLSGLDSLLFYIDLQTKATLTNYNTSNGSEQVFDSNFDNLSFAFKAGSWWGVGFGLSSLSQTDYNIMEESYIQGTVSKYNIQFEGQGGLSKVYWSNAWRLAKGLSVGLDAAYIWGNLITTKTSTFTQINGETLQNETTYYLHNMIWDAGLQYHFSLNKSKISIGATYQPKTTLLAKYKQTITGDAVYYTDEDDLTNYQLPETIGAGVGLNINKSITFAADFNFERWSQASNPIKYASLNDAYSIKAGIEFAPQKNAYQSLFNRMHYRLGANMGDTYLNVNGKTISYGGISAGLGIPLHQRRNFINIAYQYNQVGTQSAGLIKETNHTIKLGLSLSENWFFKSSFE